jgi:hypothetical protein
MTPRSSSWPSWILEDQENFFPPLNRFPFIHLSMALQPHVGPWPLFQFPSPIHSRWDSLDGRSACLKATTYTQDSINTHRHPCLGWDPSSRPRGSRGRREFMSQTAWLNRLPACCETGYLKRTRVCFPQTDCLLWLSFKFKLSWVLVRMRAFRTVATVPAQDVTWVFNILCNENWQGKPKYSRKIYQRTTLSANKSHVYTRSESCSKRWEDQD